MMNLLIVDDEYYIVQGLIRSIDRDLLQIDQIFSAYSAEQAKRIIEKEHIDLLLSDIEMPEGSGLSLIEWICDNNYPILPLLLTGHQRFDYAQRAITMHCFSYILKPVDQTRLNQELKKAIAHLTAQPLHSNTPVQSEISSDQFVTSVRNYICQHLDSPELNRSSIAEHVHMNADYFSSIFHSRFGQTLSSYIQARRIDHAKELLAATDLSVNEIADRIGIPNTSYFHRQFKKETGMTPQQYRSQEKFN